VHLSIPNFRAKYPEMFPSDQAVYVAIREEVLPRGIVVRLGRKLFINESKYQAFIEQGGAALPGGWRKEAGARSNL
jgi:hypothetical protein